MANSPSMEDMFSQILTSLNAMNSRLTTVENVIIPNSSTDIATTSNVVIPATTPTILSSSPVQHGIRAQGLWMDKTFILSRDPVRFSFKLENPEDYLTWKYSIMANLAREGLSIFVETEIPKPSETLEDFEWLMSRWEEFQATALAAIINSVGKSQISLIQSCNTAYDMWKRLKETYLQSSEINVIRLTSELHSLSMRRLDTTEIFISRINHLAEKLSSCGKPMDDATLRMILLQGLPTRFSQLRIVLLNEPNTSYYETCNKVRMHDNLDKSKDTEESGKIYITESYMEEGMDRYPKKKILKCTHCQKTGHDESTCFQKMSPEEKTQVQATWVCSLCKGKGHTKGRCPTKTDNPHQQTLLVAPSNVDKNCNDWVIDSGCTHHMCKSSIFLKSESQRNPNSPTTVFLADGKELTITNEGKVDLQLPLNGPAVNSTVLHDVLVVPGLSRNLLSVSALMRDGISVNFNPASHHCQLSRNGELWGTRIIRSNLWVITSSNDAESNNTPATANIVSSAWCSSQPQAQTFFVSSSPMAVPPAKRNSTPIGPRVIKSFIPEITRVTSVGPTPTKFIFRRNILNRTIFRDFSKTNPTQHNGSASTCLNPTTSNLSEGILGKYPPLKQTAISQRLKVSNPFQVLSTHFETSD